MTMLDRITARVGSQRAAPVPLVDPTWGGQAYSSEEWAPAEYGLYLATSNDVYSVAWLRAKMLAKLPWREYDTGGQEREGEALRLLNNPNPFYTAMRLKAWVGLSLAIWGEAFLVIESAGMDGRGRPRELWPIKPTNMRPVPHPTEFVSGFVFQPSGGQDPIPFRPDEVIWLNYPNPNDPYAPLVPMAASRLAADVASEAMRANLSLFQQGMMGGGFISPPDRDSTYTPEQAKELERLIEQRFMGRKNAHRWQVLRYTLKMEPQTIKPSDAQFIEGLNLTFRQVCRAMGVPPALVGDGEFATLANLRVYERLFWEHSGEFDALFLSEDVTRQLRPRFPGLGRVALDLEDVVALQEDEETRWRRAKEQIEVGALRVNEWREDEGMDAVPWGDVWWAPRVTLPIADDGIPTAALDATEPAPERALSRSRSARAMERLTLYTAEEDAFRDDLLDVFTRIGDAVMQRLRQRDVRTAEAAAMDPFDIPKWTERTRAATSARVVATTEKSIMSEARRLRMTPEQIAQAVQGRATRAAIEQQTQQFAKRVTQTTWNQVQRELSIGLRKKETAKQMASRVAHVMDIRAQDARMIVQSEVTRAITTGSLAAYTVAGIPFKTWRTQGDAAVRDSHMAVEGETIPVGEMFSVGAGIGYGPGQIGLAEEDVNCRCWLEPSEVEQRLEPERSATVSGNGKVDDLHRLAAALEVTST